MPQRLCARLYVEEGPCSCAPVTGTGTALGTGVTYLADGFQLSWSCVGGVYSGDGFICGGTLVDIEISFDTTDGECSAMLTSSCLGYTQVGSGTDNRLKLPMGVVGSAPYDNDVKKQSCLDFTFLFEIDLSTCDDTCETAIILIQPDNTQCFGTRMEKDTKIGTGTEENCYYTRVCMTYTQHATGNGTGNTESEVCITTDTEGGDDTWVATFLEGSVTATVSQDGSNLDQLTLSITSGTPDTATQTVTDCLTDFDITWTIDNGDILRARGSQRAGCQDCKCLCKCLCITRVNTNDGSATKSLVCWDENPGTGPEGWLGPGTGTSLELNVTCDYCNDNTVILFNIDGTVAHTPGTCPDVDISTTVEIDGVSYEYYILCDKCVPCVLPDEIEDFCGCDTIPYSFTATIEDVSDCDCADEVTTTMYYNFDPVNPAWFGVFANLCETSDIQVTLVCGGESCSDNDGCEKFELTICGNASCAEVSADCCDPFELVFTGLGGGCEVCDEPATSAFNVRLTE
jgi:hypothetical protein